MSTPSRVAAWLLALGLAAAPVSCGAPRALTTTDPASPPMSDADCITPAAAEASPSDPHLAALIGRWRGTARTWFEPGKLADESPVAGEFVPVLGGRFVRHVYVGAIQGKPRHGEDLLVRNGATDEYESSWIDDFHMSYGILTSRGPATEHGFSVTGAYDVGGGHPRWGWRTEFTLTDAEHLVITAYNITPEGEEAKAVETTYERVR